MNTDSDQKTSISIRQKLLLGFTAVSFFLIASVAITIFGITYTEKFTDRVVKVDLPTFNHFVDLNSVVSHNQLILQEMVMLRDKSLKSEIVKSWEQIGKVQTEIDSLSSSWSEKEHATLWFELKEALNQLKVVQYKIIDAVLNDQNDAAVDLFVKECNPLLLSISHKLNKVSDTDKNSILDVSAKIVKDDAQEISTDLSMVRTIEYALLAISLVASIFIALFTARKILVPLNNAIQIAKRVAAGERRNKIKILSNDETGQLLSALNTMQHAINNSESKLKENEANTRTLFDNIVKSAKLFSEHSSKVASGDFRQHLDVTLGTNSDDIMIQLGKDLNVMTDNLATITNEITQACHNMVTSLEETRHSIESQSSGASEQASSINEITASIGEIEKSSTQTMEKAKMLGEIAERTREKGQVGVEAVEQSIDGMKAVRDKVQTIAQTIIDLSNQTQQVGEITSVVNNLAQQSKMLALNASIEAAKAGEAGKGFAVVAVEVKNLAEQSEQSTAQVQKILEDIRHATEKAVMVTEEGTKGVDSGMGLIEQTGEIIRGLNEVIHEATIASQQIEAAIRQESAGIEQITLGMNEINQVTAAFVDSAKQSSEAMDNLAQISKSLKQRVDTYKT